MSRASLSLASARCARNCSRRPKASVTFLLVDIRSWSPSTGVGSSAQRSLPWDLALHGAFGKDAATFRGASTLARTRTKSPVDDRGLAAFAHVATAPATYYAYAYDRAIAKAVWADFDGAKLLRFLQVASEANDPAVPLSALLAPPQAASGGATPTRSPSRTDVASS